MSNWENEFPSWAEFRGREGTPCFAHAGTSACNSFLPFFCLLNSYGLWLSCRWVKLKTVSPVGVPLKLSWLSLLRLPELCTYFCIAQIRPCFRWWLICLSFLLTDKLKPFCFSVPGTMHAIYRYSINVYWMLLDKGEVHNQPHQHSSVCVTFGQLLNNISVLLFYFLMIKWD